jgi:hypothetical protein
MRLDDIRPANDLPAFLSFFGSERGLSQRGIWRHVRKDGSIVHVEITTSPIQWKGRSSRFVLAANVTHRRRADRRVALQSAVARILSEESSFEAATPRLLQAVCDALGWEWGELWQADDRSGELNQPVPRRGPA